MADEPKIRWSIIIPTYNRAHLLERTLQSMLFQLKEHDDYEVLVCVDDDPEHADDTMICCRNAGNAGLNMRVLNTAPYKIHGGWCAETYPINVGIRQARGENILLNCGEVMMLTDVLSVHDDIFFWAGRGEKNIAIFSTVYFMSAHLQGKIDEVDWKTDPWSIVREYKPDDYCAPWNCRPLHFQMGIKRKHLMEMGGMEELYFGSYGLHASGDDDLAFRLGKMNILFVFSDRAAGLHQWHPANTENTRGVKTGVRFSSYNKMHKVDHIRNCGWNWGEYPRSEETMKKIQDLAAQWDKKLENYRLGTLIDEPK